MYKQDTLKVKQRWLPEKKITLLNIFTSTIRSVPDYFIIGTPRGGTSSMYNYLIQHPNVVPPVKKEIQYFTDLKYSKHYFFWYKANFPTKMKKGSKLTGDGNPNTIFHPLAPRRVKKHLPKIKLISLLRNPIDRAFSAWNLQVKKGINDLSFEDSLELEKCEYSDIREKIFRDKKFNAPNYLRHAFLQKGIYVDQLEEWFKYFPKNQMLIIKSEDFITETNQILSQVFDFLGLSQFDIQTKKKWHTGTYKQKMNPETRKRLIEYFKPHNERLSELLDRDFGWDV